MNAPTLPGKVICDQPHCGWTARVENTFDWRDEPCPHCGHPLMDDKSKLVIDGVKLLMGAGLAFAPGTVPAGLPTVGLTINSKGE